MLANAATYLPVDAPDLSKVFLDARSNAGIFKRRASRFTVPLNGSIATSNVMPARDLPSPQCRTPVASPRTSGRINTVPRP